MRLVLTALLTALIIVMAFTPLGYLKAGAIEITFITIPVIIGAVLLGPVGGLFLGAVFGITSFIQCFGMSTFGVALFSVSPLRTAIVCIVPRVLMGWLTAVIFKAVSSKDKTSFVQYLVASIAGPLLNTILFTGTLLLLFNNAPIIIQLKEQFGSTNVMAFAAAFVGVNGLIEAGVCAVLGTALCKALSVAMKKMKNLKKLKLSRLYLNLFGLRCGRFLCLLAQTYCFYCAIFTNCFVLILQNSTFAIAHE